eukprot:GILK01016584.1.p1 GENE.GILK01016584.1~~GILK01016584.1.p1  ORF type:complete len:528 (-),score=46.42 GILK01016584.1:155-1738(-)
MIRDQIGIVVKRFSDEDLAVKFDKTFVAVILERFNDTGDGRSAQQFVEMLARNCFLQLFPLRKSECQMIEIGLDQSKNEFMVAFMSNGKEVKRRSFPTKVHPSEISVAEQNALFYQKCLSAVENGDVNELTFLVTRLKQVPKRELAVLEHDRKNGLQLIRKALGHDEILTISLTLSFTRDDFLVGYSTGFRDFKMGVIHTCCDGNDEDHFIANDLRQLLTAFEKLVPDDRSLVECKDSDGCSPLHYCVEYDHIESAQVLLQFSANPYQMNDFDRPCIFGFAFDGTKIRASFKMLQLLAMEPNFFDKHETILLDFMKVLDHNRDGHQQDVTLLVQDWHRQRQDPGLLPFARHDCHQLSHVHLQYCLSIFCPRCFEVLLPYCSLDDDFFYKLENKDDEFYDSLSTAIVKYHAATTSASDKGLLHSSLLKVYESLSVRGFELPLEDLNCSKCVQITTNLPKTMNYTLATLQNGDDNDDHYLKAELVPANLSSAAVLTKRRLLEQRRLSVRFSAKKSGQNKSYSKNISKHK